MPAPSDIDKEALKLVALDRQLAAATVQALRSWAARKKASTRTFRAMLFAESIAAALEATKDGRQ